MQFRCPQVRGVVHAWRGIEQELELGGVPVAVRMLSRVLTMASFFASEQNVRQALAAI